MVGEGAKVGRDGGDVRICTPLSEILDTQLNINDVSNNYCKMCSNTSNLLAKQDQNCL